MKPRTKLQFRVAELSKKLPRISKEQMNWAYKECLPHLGYANKSSAFCLDCGKSFGLNLIKNKRATCPNCSTRLYINYTRKTTCKEVFYFAITHLVEDFQVVENFELIAYYKKGKPVTHFLHAILEDWILPNGKVQKIGLLHSLNFVKDSWCGTWKIRQPPKGWYNKDKYNIIPWKYHPDSKFKPEYKKIGVNSHLSGLSVWEAITIIPNEPKGETLLKAKQFSLLNRMVSNRGDIYRFWPSIKIAIRNKYKINDCSIWIDYLGLLAYFKKDLHNHKYVCPKNLKREHDRLVTKKQEHQKREELEKKKIKAIEDQKVFVEHIRKFLGLQFSSGEITIKVLESVEEFINEGDVLKHCVFANDYHLKQDALILSARIKGTPIETIEVSLKNFKIIQSRGFQNNPSEHNKKIVALVRKNIPQIKKLTAKAV